MEHSSIIRRAYTDFNKRDIDTILKFFHHQIEWPNGWEGGYVHGHDEVRDYWTRQWKELDPMVFPIGFKQLGDDRLEVNVKQVIKSLDGQVLADVMVIHTYLFDGDQIKKMIITSSD